MTRALHFAARSHLALPAGALAALVWANSGPESYFPFAAATAFAVNNVAMVFFFALITEEILEATVPGRALHSWRRLALPVVGAVGGILGAALVYGAYLRAGDEGAVLSRAWPIPGATDVAFGYLVARVIWRRHPAVPFLLLIGIATDVLGTLIVELRYPIGEGHLAGILLFAAAIDAAIALRVTRVKSAWPYIAIAGTLSWWGLFLCGLHPALALVPIMPFLTHAARPRALFSEAPARARDGLSAFDRAWRGPVQAVLFAFALVNAGVTLRGAGTGTWAVAAAALVGKPIGVLIAVGLAVAAGLQLPPRVGWRELTVFACISSIGFTFALFFATAAVPIGPVLGEVKLGALLTAAGSAIAILSAVVLRVGRFAGQRPPYDLYDAA